MRKCVVLLSGGIDSAVVAALAKTTGFEVYALTFDYGQTKGVEIDAAQRIAEHLQLKDHKVSYLPLASMSTSGMLIETPNIPKDRTAAQIYEGVPPTYVPSRNGIFIMMAASYAESMGATDIFIGTSESESYAFEDVDQQNVIGSPDIPRVYMDMLESVLNIGTKSGIEGNPFRIHTPLMGFTKGGTIQLGYKLGVNFSLTVSCYEPQFIDACGHCDACVVRRHGFLEAGFPDPASTNG